ncbi:hypothetical protein DPMN_162229 [Dreissena polymorpha]|uniref:Uncharacterized protein n=1 Tax=Dreissena polymorpha TaxID=45954 RepID=A0A9D4EUH7_DREPO|nr:hypothetical protein DPMN_162229 [Dreissena polymorpha]
MRRASKDRHFARAVVLYLMDEYTCYSILVHLNVQIITMLASNKLVLVLVLLALLTTAIAFPMRYGRDRYGNPGNYGNNNGWNYGNDNGWNNNNGVWNS